MDISARTMYGLRALVTLAGMRTDSPMSIQTISDMEGLPAKFLEGIMADLKRGGFVRSRRGANGGYLLARPASEITVLDIIRHLEGPVAIMPFQDNSGGSRPTARQQAFTPVWEEVRDAQLRILQRHTIQAIADVVGEIDSEDFTPIYQI